MNLASTTAITAAFAHPPIDWVILLAFVLIVLVDALRSGTARAATLSVAFPLAFFLYDLLPHTAILAPLLEKITAPLMQAGVFGVIFGVLFFLVYRIVYSLSSAGDTPTTAVVGSLAAAVITLTIWLQVPALQSVWHFGPMIQAVFGAAYAFWWLIAAFFLMAFARS